MKNYHLSDKRTISARKAMEILRKHGTVVSINEAEIILDFMYKFAKLSLKQVLERGLEMFLQKLRHRAACLNKQNYMKNERRKLDETSMFIRQGKY